MIISNLIGGLGNQMFQYACARSLSIHLKMPLKFCIDGFETSNSHNGFEIHRVFNIDMAIASGQEIRSLVGLMPRRRGLNLLARRAPLRWLIGRRYIVEPKFNYWPELCESARNGSFLHGYWQSEKYFRAHAQIIREDFIFKSPLSGRSLEVARLIQQSLSISVHIRRGDYVKNSKTHAVHGICSLEYYKKSINMLLVRFPGAKFFAFSDDPIWVSEMLIKHFPDMLLVDCNKGESSYNDMRLMSMCQHNIIANSTFSWWGAWLNPNPNKVVIAPKNWFANDTDSSDLIPIEWERY